MTDTQGIKISYMPRRKLEVSRECINALLVFLNYKCNGQQCSECIAIIVQ